MIDRWFPRAAGCDDLKLFDLATLDWRRRSRNEAAIRRRCATVDVGEGSRLCRVLGRYKMYVDPRDLSVAPHLMLDGYWELWLTEAIVRAVRPGMRVIDVGANLGYFSLLLADLVGEAGHVHAFEPNPELQVLARQSFVVNGYDRRVTLHGEALSDVDGERVTLSWDPQMAGGGHTHQGASNAHGNNWRVMGRRLDSFPELLDADLIKIDAESAEWAIWRGARELFLRQRPLTIFLEVAPCRYDNAAEFLGEIEQYGFALSLVSPDRGVRPITREEVLRAPDGDDVMLMLTR